VQFTGLARGTHTIDARHATYISALKQSKLHHVYLFILNK